VCCAVDPVAYKRPPWCVWSVLCHIVLLCCTHLLLCPLCCVCLSVSCRRRRLVKESHGRGRARPGHLTNRYQHGRPNQNPSVLACGTPYQSLPDPVLAVRNPLVHLAWSWVRLPGLTILWIWLHSCRGEPLPTSASGSEGLDTHSTHRAQHSTAGDEYSTVEHSRTMWHSIDQTHQGGRI
jgi:hypothetical protein